ncbi:MAG: hypothetical protein J1G04_04760 [Clostridiales bacterium]|nr:hypothetical protein [Clostridiales bacterium]
MDTDHYRSRRSAKITISSELEPVEVKGEYTEDGDGFTLAFIIDESKYVLTHGERTVLAVNGLISYTLDFSCTADVKITTPAGALCYAFTPDSCSIGMDGDDITAELKYTLDDGEEVSSRSVNIHAIIERGSHEN